METDAQNVVRVMQQYGQPITKADLKALTELSAYGLMKALRHVRYEKHYSAGIRKPALYNLKPVEEGTTSFKRGPTRQGGKYTAPPGVVASAIQRAIERAKRALNENEIYHALLSSLPAEYAKNLELRKLKALLSWYVSQNRLGREEVETPGIAGKVSYYRVLKDLQVGRYNTAAPKPHRVTLLLPRDSAEREVARTPVLAAAKAFQELENEYTKMLGKLTRIKAILEE